jgi:hypothetical protein
MSRTLLSVVLTLVIGPTMGCQDPSQNDADLGDSATPVVLEAGAPEATFEIDPNIGTVVHATWLSEVEGTVFVEFGLETLDQSTPEFSAATAATGIPVLGLKAAHAYRRRAVLVTADGKRLEGETVTIELAYPPEGIPSFALLSKTEDSQVSEGYVAVGTIGLGNSTVVILDADADIVWYHFSDNDMDVISVEVGLDGKSLIWAQFDRGKDDDVGNARRAFLDGSGSVATRTTNGHHDFVEHADGTFAWLAYDNRLVEIDGQLEDVYTDELVRGVQGQSGSDETELLFNFFDDYGVDPWWVCDHMGTVEFVDGADWTHSNSLMYFPPHDAYYLMPRRHDTMLKIDAQSGELLWQAGGPNSTFSYNPDHLWSHAHMSQVWDGGFTLFNNGDHLVPQVSSAQEWSWDEDTQEMNLVWEYKDPEGRYITMVGDTRKLSGGNYLVSWTTLGRLTEVTPDNELVWEAEVDTLGETTVRTRWLPSLYDLRADPKDPEGIFVR